MKKNAALILLAICALWNYGCVRNDQTARKNAVLSVYQEGFRITGESNQVDILGKLSVCLSSYKFASCQEEKRLFQNSLVGEGERKISPALMALFEYTEAIQVPIFAGYALYIKSGIILSFLFVIYLIIWNYLHGERGPIVIGIIAIGFALVLFRLEGAVEDEANEVAMSATNKVLSHFSNLPSVREVGRCLKTNKMRMCQLAISRSMEESRNELKNNTSDYQKLLWNQIKTINAM